MNKIILILVLMFVFGWALGFIGGIFLYYSWIFSFLLGLFLVIDRPTFLQGKISDRLIIVSVGSGIFLGQLFFGWFAGVINEYIMWMSIGITLALFFLGTVVAHWLDS